MSEMESKKTSGMAGFLNGIVGGETASSCGSDVSITDLQYELFYSISEHGDDDRIFYDFDTFPTKKNVDIEGQTLQKANRKLSAHSRASVVSFSGTVKDNGQSKSSSVHNKEASVPENSLCAFNDSSTLSLNEHREFSDPPVKQPTTCPRESNRRHKSASSIGSYGSHTCSKCSARQPSLNRSDSVGTGRSQTRMSDVTDKTTNTKLALQRKKSVTYDPALDKATAFLHSGGKSFSRANTSLTPVRYGLKHLQTNYTETNLQNNNGRIFLDLLKSSHQKNYIRNTSIRNIETRLEVKRNNPHFFTSFYDHNKIPDPLGRNNKKNVARSVAQKKLERKEKIKSATDELHYGYIPTVLTMKHADQAETEDIGLNCRYLRCRGPSIRPSANRSRSASVMKQN